MANYMIRLASGSLLLAGALCPIMAAASSALKTYTNVQYGFSIQYPSLLKAVPASRPTYEYQPPSFYSDDFVTVAEFAMPDGHSSIPDDATSIYGALQISVGSTKADLASCMSKPVTEEDSDTEISPIQMTSINGVRFMAFDLWMIGMGNRFGERSFSTIHHRICYNIRIIASGRLFDANPGVSQQESAEDAKRLGLPFSAYDIFFQLTPAIQTFRFTEK